MATTSRGACMGRRRQPATQDPATGVYCASGARPQGPARLAAARARGAAWHPAWRSAKALAIAGDMYDRRDFSAAPVLADALEDAGCADAVILDHLRGPGPHVRGCFAVDLVLDLS